MKLTSISPNKSLTITVIYALYHTLLYHITVYITLFGLPKTPQKLITWHLCSDYITLVRFISHFLDLRKLPRQCDIKRILLYLTYFLTPTGYCYGPFYGSFFFCFSKIPHWLLPPWLLRCSFSWLSVQFI